MHRLKRKFIVPLILNLLVFFEWPPISVDCLILVVAAVSVVPLGSHETQPTRWEAASDMWGRSKAARTFFYLHRDHTSWLDRDKLLIRLRLPTKENPSLPFTQNVWNSPYQSDFGACFHHRRQQSQNHRGNRLRNNIFRYNALIYHPWSISTHFYIGISYVTTEKSDIDDINIISAWPGELAHVQWKVPTRF